MTAPIEVGDEVEGEAHPASSYKGMFRGTVRNHPAHADGIMIEVGPRDLTGHLLRRSTLRLIRKRAESSAPSEEPKVGETWEFETAGEIRVEIVAIDSDGYFTIRWPKEDPTYRGLTVAGFGRGQLRRRVSPAPSDETKAVTLQDLHDNPEIFSSKPDPYRTPATETTSYAIWAAKQDERHAAMVQKHAADLDRSTESRLVALGGRYGKRVGLVNRNWPSQEDD